MSYFGDINFRFCMHRFYNSPQLHFKPVANSIEFIRNGQCYLRRKDTIISLKAPVVFWLQEGEIYSFLFDKKNQKSCEHLYFDCEGERSRQMIEYLQAICPEGYVTPNDPEKISHLFFDEIKYFRLDPDHYRPEMLLNLDAVILEIVRSLRKKLAPENDPYKIKQLAADMRKEPFQTYDIPAFAKKQGVTQQHFRRLFRQEHKLPPAQYLRDQKMTRAAELLSMTNMLIKEIAFNCKYESLMDFSRTFRKFSGYSPMEYRKRQRNKNDIFIPLVPQEK